MLSLKIHFETVHHKTDTDTIRPKSVGENLLGLLAALGAGIVFGLVLAGCFLEGQSEGAASVKTFDLRFFSYQTKAVNEQHNRQVKRPNSLPACTE